jgi:hypothetical protein
MIDGRSCGRKRLLPISRKYVGTFLEGLRKFMGSSTRIAGFPADILNRRFQNMRKV